jgi:hypothetical protein
MIALYHITCPILPPVGKPETEGKVCQSDLPFQEKERLVSYESAGDEDFLPFLLIFLASFVELIATSTVNRKRWSECGKRKDETCKDGFRRMWVVGGDAATRKVGELVLRFLPHTTYPSFSIRVSGD